MSKNLVIVESPAKAKTIEKYLGKDYKVLSSFGHIRDLPKKGMSIDVEHDFKPTYQISADKKKIVSELRKAALSAEAVWLASDEDREGEAIAWHLAEALKLDVKKTKRIVFHEITKSAIDHAILTPRLIDTNLVNAQQARRILDRLVGYELSPVLWKKVRPGLSAGRVQSVAVRLIVEREREILNFESGSTYKIIADFESGDGQLQAELSERLKDINLAKILLKKSINSTFKVSDISKKPSSRNPSAPFTTSSLQQESARRLGYSVRQTMTLAQRLYESGQITYMRTDSPTLSGFAIKAAEEQIIKSYGVKYHKIRQFKSKNSSAQEAHEAIRPTNFAVQGAGSDDQQKKLYDLIWQRSIASQMTPALLDRTDIIINTSSGPEIFNAKGEVLIFDGFLRVYGGGKADTLLPKVNNGEKLTLNGMSAVQTFARPLPRYSEASLVKKLEELGIGRPSTYAPTINTIQSRGYIEKGDLEGDIRQIKQLKIKDNEVLEDEVEERYGADKNKLLPTPLADVTTDFLVKHFPRIVDFDFTAHVEADFDVIAEGKQKWVDMIKGFYKDFHPLIESSDSISRQDSMQARELGVDPKSGKPIFARYGKFGPMIQRGETESDDKPDFAPMPTGATITNVTLDQALEMLQLPRLVGKTIEGDEIKSNFGRFGPYIQIKSLYVSIKPLDPRSITEAEARQLYKEKLEKDANKYIKEFDGGIKIVNGPYGPYVTDGKKNARIAKSTDPTKLTEKECKMLLDKAPAKKRGFKRRVAKK